jgi:hypothetical protein
LIAAMVAVVVLGVIGVACFCIVAASARENRNNLRVERARRDLARQRDTREGAGGAEATATGIPSAVEENGVSEYDDYLGV